ncbi:MAG: PilN domain-containing protein [Phycisphaerales bacterium]|nr:PilN domain-containing protein [Phycisphaerales bacterium]
MSRGVTRSGPASFLPEDYVRGKDEARWNVISLLLFGVVMVAVVSAFVLTNRRWQSVRADQGQIRVEFEEEAVKIEALKALEKQRVEMMDKAAVVAALRDNVPRSVLMAELWRAKPKEATLTEIKLAGERVKIAPPAPAPGAQKGKPVVSLKPGTTAPSGEPKPEDTKIVPPEFKHMLTVEGVSEGNDQIADYLARLKASPLLKNVELQFISETTLEGLKLRKFRITATLDPDADASAVKEAEETTLFDETASLTPDEKAGKGLWGLFGMGGQEQ